MICNYVVSSLNIVAFLVNSDADNGAAFSPLQPDIYVTTRFFPPVSQIQHILSFHFNRKKLILIHYKHVET